MSLYCESGEAESRRAGQRGSHLQAGRRTGAAMQVEGGAGGGASQQPQPKHGGIELRQIKDGRKKSAGSRGVGAGEDNPGFLDEGG